MKIGAAGRAERDGVGLAAAGGIDVGLWVCQNYKIGGDSWHPVRG
jgi:hypothetical protein